MSDPFQFYRDALAGKKPPIYADHPQQGYYRMRKERNGAWLPVLIIEKNGILVARVGGERADPQKIWTYCGGNPVKQADAKHAFEHGHWPGDVAPPIGHNTQQLTLAEEIEDALRGAQEWLTKTAVDNKVAADRAANYRDRLNELAGKYEAEREAKIRPHLKAQRAINAEYKPLLTRIEDLVKRIRLSLGTYLSAEKAKAQKAAEEAARAENERRRIEHEKAQRMAQVPDEVPALELVAPELVKVQVGGQRGRRTGLKTVKDYKISDYVAALEAVKTEPEVMTAVGKAAFRLAKAGKTVPGVEVVESEVAA